MKKNIVSIILLLLCLQLSAQQMDNLTRGFNSFRNNNLQEKLYAHTDRELYLCGEIIWFKIYNVNGLNHQLLDMSKVAYVELIGKKGERVLQAKIDLKNGMGDGSFFLPTSIESGNYIFRSYTNWMKNYDEEFYFNKQITIVNPFRAQIGQVDTLTSKPDFQLLPEGGNLIAGIQNKVAFKANTAHGKGLNFDGVLCTADGDTVLSFQPEIYGMGHFSFTPSRDRAYVVKISLKADSQVYIYQLPRLHGEGVVINLESLQNELRIKIKKTNKIDSAFYLLAHGRQGIIIKRPILTKNDSAEIILDKEQLGAGINHFTLFDRFHNPISERLYFKSPDRDIEAEIETQLNQLSYMPREQISFGIKLNDENEANLSVAVYALDSLNEPGQTNIENYLLLTSDLKGKIEDPDYYFNEHTPADHIDLLMLTHGWRRFSWKNVLSDEKLEKKYIPEIMGHIITTKWSHKGTDQLVNDKLAYLTIPGKTNRATGAKSDDKGVLLFQTQDLYGTSSLHFRPETGNDSLYVFEIQSPFSAEPVSFKPNRLELNPELEDQITSRSMHMQTQNSYFFRELNKITTDSNPRSFYYQADKTYLLDEFTRFPIMEDVLREYVMEVQVREKEGSFNFRVFDNTNDDVFDENPIVFYDGRPIFDINEVMELDPLNIEKIEVVARRFFLGPMTFSGIVSLTTYEGDLKGLDLSSSTNIIDYGGLQEKREFYQPAYHLANNNQRLPDYRNLLYWNPNITASKTAEKLSFYTSDLEGEFMIEIEGLSGNGKPIHALQRFKVINKIN